MHIFELWMYEGEVANGIYSSLCEGVCAYTLVEVFVASLFHDIGIDSLVGGTFTSNPSFI